MGCRRACVNSSSARSSSPARWKSCASSNTRGLPLVRRQIGAVEQVLVHADGAIDLALPAEQVAQREVQVDRLRIDLDHLDERLDRLVGLLVQQEVEAAEVRQRQRARFAQQVLDVDARGDPAQARRTARGSAAATRARIPSYGTSLQRVDRRKPTLPSCAAMIAAQATELALQPRAANERRPAGPPRRRPRTRSAAGRSAAPARRTSDRSAPSPDRCSAARAAAARERRRRRRSSERVSCCGSNERRHVRYCRPVDHQPFFSSLKSTRSRNSLPALKCGTCFSGTCTRSPDLGLRPVRGGR